MFVYLLKLWQNTVTKHRAKCNQKQNTWERRVCTAPNNASSTIATLNWHPNWFHDKFACLVVSLVARSILIFVGENEVRMCVWMCVINSYLINFLEWRFKWASASCLPAQHKPGWNDCIALSNVIKINRETCGKVCHKKGELKSLQLNQTCEELLKYNLSWI